jgi:hypothetical protein
MWPWLPFVCLFSVAQLFLALAVLVRLIPAFARFMRLCLRAFFILSYRLYALVLWPIATPLKKYLGLNILAGLWRVLATVGLSLGVGLALVVITHGPLTGWIVALFVLHGLIVGLVWDEIEHPSDLQLGAKIQ